MNELITNTAQNVIIKEAPNYSIIEILNALTVDKKGRINNAIYEAFKVFVDRTQKTLDTYTRNLRPFNEWLKANHNPQPTKADIVHYRDAIAIDHKPATVQAYLIAIKVLYRFLEENGVCSDIAKNIHGVKLDRGHKKDYLTTAQVKNVLSAIDITTDKGKRDFAILSLMFTGGLRTIEISRACVGDLGTAGEYPALYVQGKGHLEKTDFIKIVPQVEAAIRSYLKTRKDATADAPLFASLSHRDMGAPLSTRSVSRIVKGRFKSAGYDSDRLTAHSTRHTAVTLALLAGDSLQDVQEFARHKNQATTLIYAHNMDRTKSNVEKHIGAAIFG